MLHAKNLAFLGLVLALPGTAATQVVTMPPLPPAIEEYLDAALDTLEAVTLDRDAIDWQVVRDSTFYFAAGAEQTKDTYAALSWALGKVNKHSFLQAPRPGVVTELLAGRLGYVRVPFRGNNPVPLADSLHRGVAALVGEGACGWIVDLRGNGGGNVWPMLAGIGPLLGDSIVGAFGTGPDAEQRFYRGGRAGLLKPDGTLEVVTSISGPPIADIGVSAPVAVLLDEGTGSSGEAVVVSFLGRPNLRTFGARSAGFTSTNRGARLPDGANMVVTVGYASDRSGREHNRQLVPDHLIPSPPTGWPSPRDRVARTAAAWLQGHPGCPMR